MLRVPGGIDVIACGIFRGYSNVLRKFQPCKNLKRFAHGGKPPVLVLAGPTAVGKSAVAMHLAEQLNGEIVSADSVQVFKGMDVGTAKPTKEEQQAVTHHLIDILPPSQNYSAGDFQRRAREVIADIVSRGKTPLVVGGTAFYLRLLVQGMPMHGVASISPELQLEIKDNIADMEWDDAFGLLQAQDEAYAASLHRNDWRRLERGLAILKSTGKPIPPYPMSKNTDIDDDFDFRCIYLTAPRTDLVTRINERCEDIVHAGLVEESVRLQAAGLDPFSNAGKAVGYRQALEYLETEWKTTKTRFVGLTMFSLITFFLRKYRSVAGRRRKFSRFLQQYQGATRTLARKQSSWFRKEPRYWWLMREEDDEDVTIAEWIADKFVRPEWSLPSIEALQKRVAVDKEYALQASKKKNDRLFHLYSEEEIIDFKISSIRKTVDEHFPEYELHFEEQDIAERKARKDRRRGRISQDDDYRLS
eukprot:m.100220 g.100220  ORF g.100220 m.100220 type:complete len:474 (-) comp13694_c0_seq4:134-1555(-)